MTPQSVRDSLADAETLRLFAREYYPHAILDPIAAAGKEGSAAACYMEEGYCTQSARDAAMWAASLAYVAVPGLAHVYDCHFCERVCQLRLEPPVLLPGSEHEFCSHDCAAEWLERQGLICAAELNQ